MARRAGRWAQRKANRRNWRFILRNPLAVGLLVLLDALIATVLGLLAPAPGDLFLAGFAVGMLPFALLYMAQGVTGSGGSYMGGVAEGWTSSELRKFIRRARKERGEGWRLVDHIPVTGWDIDHVLLGPGGIFAIESKWSAESWSSRWARGRLTDVARSARVDARKVESILRSEPHRLHLPVTPLVVVWPNEARTTDLEPENGTETIYGGSLVGWCSELLGADLDARTVEAAWSALAHFVQMRDACELREAGAGPLRRRWYRLRFDPSR